MYNNVLFSNDFTVEIVFIPETSPNAPEVVGYAFSTTDSGETETEFGRQGWVLYDTFLSATTPKGTLVMRGPTGAASSWPSTWVEWKAAASRSSQSRDGSSPADRGGHAVSFWKPGARYVHVEWQSTRDATVARSLIEDSLPAPVTSAPAGTSVGSMLSKAQVSPRAVPAGTIAVRPTSPAQPGSGATRPSPQAPHTGKPPTSSGATYSLRPNPRPFRCFGWGGQIGGGSQQDLPDFDSGGQFFDKWVLYGGTHEQFKLQVYGTDPLPVVSSDPNAKETNTEYWVIPFQYIPVQAEYDLRSNIEPAASLGGGSSETTPEDPTSWVLPALQVYGSTLLVAKCTYFSTPPASR